MSGATAGAPGDLARMPYVVALLRIGSLRFSAFYFVSYYTAIAANGEGGAFWVAASATICLLVSAGIQYLNLYTDQDEDAINNPGRTAVCHQVGYGTIRAIAVGCFAVLVPIGFVWFYTYNSVQLAIMQTIVWLVAINYSHGLRFKGRRWAVTVALTGTLVLPFVVGWMMFASIFEIPPALLAPAVFVFTVSGTKDITDEAGDLKTGYRSLHVSLLRRRVLGWWLYVLLPYVFIVALVAAGLAPARMLALLAFMPLSVLIARMSRGAQNDVQRLSIRELNYHMWMLFLVACLFLLFPDRDLGLVLLGALAFWLGMSRWLHWVSSPTLAQLRAAFSALGSSRGV